MSRKKSKKPEPLLKTYSPVHSLGAEAVLRANYQAVFALIRGGPEQPRLPLELVLYICRLARFAKPNPNIDVSMNRVIPGLSMPPRHDGMNLKHEILLKTPPLIKPNGRSLDIDRFEVVVKSVRGPAYQNRKCYLVPCVRIFPPTQPEKVLASSRNRDWVRLLPNDLVESIPRSELANTPVDLIWHAAIDINHTHCRGIRSGDSFELAVINYRSWGPDDSCHV
ncbi:hypothetical protein BDV93DRAFT_524475, partial [Ceratobasidium sp. AG-I]